MRATERTSSNAVSNASPAPSGGAQGQAGAPARRAARRRIGVPFSLWLFPAASAVAALHLAGCWPLSYVEDCKEDSRYCPSEPTGGGNGPGPTCEPDPTQDASTVVDRCAVFASAGAASEGDGTKARPYASLSEALANANGKRVLACSSGVFAESVTVRAAVEVIGGFDCGAGWAWSPAARSAIDGPANKVALTLTEEAGGARVRSFTISAANATAPGGSSIGVAVADIDAQLEQVDVIAGNGVNGASGETPEVVQDGADALEDVSSACLVAVYSGQPGVTTCADGETSGGAGGLGGQPAVDEGRGQTGSDGTPGAASPPASGIGGIGHGQTGETGETVECRDGASGARGASGGAGTAGNGTTLTLASITGGDGGTGGGGTRGQGGGGGGGAKAGRFCMSSGGGYIDGAGASGGGGGAGGCGGTGGGGGKAGGSSIGILSLGTKLALTDVTIAVGKAGHGGEGGGGSPGGEGGMGGKGGSRVSGAGSLAGCMGGKGGAGGDGGPGGGGRGGHAVGIAYKVTPSPAAAEVPFTGGTAGNGGSAGLGGSPGSGGAAGVSGACWDFATNQSCPRP
ncbi:hypothetical protein [Sorangium sp. So ce426]|uniref:hypothetical protein n=1 Tax=Sorangium sp. So ce426 TaxID=3133312 RepID=UPI003F5BA05E